MTDEEKSLLETLNRRLYDFNLHLERMKLGQYIKLLDAPGRLLFLNFISGIARGVGIVVGFALLGAVIVFILQRLLVLHLPFISSYIAEVVKLVQLKLGY